MSKFDSITIFIYKLYIIQFKVNTICIWDKRLTLKRDGIEHTGLKIGNLFAEVTVTLLLETSYQCNGIVFFGIQKVTVSEFILAILF